MLHSMAFCCFVLCPFGVLLFHFLPSCVTHTLLWLHEHSKSNLKWEVRLLVRFITTLQKKVLSSVGQQPLQDQLTQRKQMQ